MATLDEIFAAMPDAPAGGTHELLIIDPDTRQIYVPEIEKVFGVITDGNAEKKLFQCPRYVGKGIDLAGCKLRIAYQNASGTEEGRDGYLVTDLTESGGYVYFSWELSEKVCLFQGPVQFAVCATQGSTVVWNTDAATGTVLGGLPFNGEIVQTEMQDVIAQLLALVETQSAAVEAVGAEQVQTVEDAAKAAQAAAVAEIEAKKQNTLAEIPDDYTAMTSQVDKLTRSTAGAIVCQAEGETIQAADASNHPLHGLRIFGRSTQDGTPSPDAPVDIVNVKNPAVMIRGKNLLTYPYFSTTMTMGGVTFTDNGDGSISIKGTATTIAYFILTNTLDLGANVMNAIEAEYATDGVYTVSKRIYYNATSKVTSINIYTGDTVDETLYPQIEAGTTPTEYEPPKPAQDLTVANGLPGIPVASGGNYTDADGQQWICDEVDLARGVYVQRIAEKVFTGTEDFGGYSAGLTRTPIYIIPEGLTSRSPCLCNCLVNVVDTSAALATGGTVCIAQNGFVIHIDGVQGVGDGAAYATQAEMITTLKEKLAFLAENGTPLTVQYILTAPIETPLSEAELAAFSALHSNKPTTTILNDSGAHVAVEYVADTKLYIDKKIAELITANNT